MRPLLCLSFLLVSIGMQSAYGQSKSITPATSRFQLSDTEFYMQIPYGFVPNEATKDEYVFQKKGSVLKFSYVKNISTTTFCDSLTPTYFAAQGLSDIEIFTEEKTTFYTGKFMINEIPYIRAFYIYPYKNSTILGIAHYPEKIKEDFEHHFLSMFNYCEHE